ncbi:TspO/MBR family protein [Singulisphaera sp. PoT]|uniref:TspO/MBR family protein n=1 Tax=Singulisphaera sp. PoT TaxID=3411797 RepID=UPI003BF519AF
MAVCFGAAGVGGAITSTSVTSWYQTLAKPSWTPPDWLFGPVWTLLYFMMAAAAWLVWRRSGWSSGKMPLALFGLQLALNVLWSGVFFGLRSPGWAFVEILGLWLTISSTALAFRPFSLAAAWMMVPYLAWTTFAACSNFQIWRLNG